MNAILQVLIPLLPRHTEEGGDASRMGREKLMGMLIEGYGADRRFCVETTLVLTENLLASLSLLDDEDLARGDWKFVSHPAQLCALSLLHTLADPRQRLFPSGFWQTAGVGDDEKQRQKMILEALEDRRYAHHLDAVAPPIRFVYVAWGIVKLGDKILFHLRETREHANEYGLVGGRTNTKDLKKIMGEETPKSKLLEALQSPNSEWMFKALEYTLRRECLEEIGLDGDAGNFVEHVWRNLKPYTQCMGGAPNYALTQYFFRLYHLKLSTTGYFALRKTMRNNPRLIECTMDEITQGKTRDGGKTLKIDVLYEDFGGDRTALRQALAVLEPSYVNRYLFKGPDDTLIISLDKDILRGKSGKEKSLPTTLTQQQKSFLLALAAHGKGLDLALADAEAVELREFGWIEAHDETLQTSLQELAERLREAGLPCVEVIDSRYFRLSLPPELIFFDPIFFVHNVETVGSPSKIAKWKLSIGRKTIPTALGEVKEALVSKEIGQKNRQTSDGDNTESIGERLHALSAIMKTSGYERFDDTIWRKKYPFYKSQDAFIKDTDDTLENGVRLASLYQKLGLHKLLVIRNMKSGDKDIRKREFFSCPPVG